MATNRIRALPWVGSALVFGLAMAVAARATAVVCTPTVKWIWDGDLGRLPDAHPCSTPLVLQLTDDDSNGRIDVYDVPDVVILHNAGVGIAEGAGFSVVDGATGVEHFRVDSPPLMLATLAAADLDGDGVVEIVGIHEAGTPSSASSMTAR